MRLIINIVNKLSNNLEIDFMLLTHMPGSPFSWEERGNPIEETPVMNVGGDEYIDHAYAEYLGGHPLCAGTRNTEIYAFDNRLEIDGLFSDNLQKPNSIKLVIPYSEIHNVQNANESEISALRILMFGLVGAFWKKKHLYTIIQYKDDVGEKSLVLEFDDRDIQRMQSIIYEKMVEFKRR
jgi:hypothetical protein